MKVLRFLLIIAILFVLGNFAFGYLRNHVANKEYFTYAGPVQQNANAPPK